eukprot:scaffold3324_cov371-Prasinococcus_capsulatus_cf.AAC.10
MCPHACLRSSGEMLPSESCTTRAWSWEPHTMRRHCLLERHGFNLVQEAKGGELGLAGGPCLLERLRVDVTVAHVNLHSGWRVALGDWGARLVHRQALRARQAAAEGGHPSERALHPPQRRRRCVRVVCLPH